MTDDELAWLAHEFERTRHWIEAALDHDIGTHDIDDVWNAIEAGAAQLWPTPNAVMVTAIEEYPRKKMLRGWLAGGSLREIINAEPDIRAWAERQGCNLVLIAGRRGWARVFPGYREVHTTIVRSL